MIINTYTVEIYDDGTIHWLDEQGKLHRDEGPALIRKGSEEYYKHGKFHRANGLPALIYENGDKHYYEYGQRHRGGGLPAIEYANGVKYYYEHGECHREGGLPAVSRPKDSGLGSDEYYVHNQYLTEAEAKKLARPDLCADKIVEIEGRKYKLTPVI